MAIEKRADAEPIRGYRLIEPLGSGGFGEVWKCEAPGGIFKAIKFVYGSVNGLGENSGHAEEELRAFQLIKSIRHPFLLSIDRVEVVSGELVIVTELADQNLEELADQYRQQRLPGMPREELLGYLQESAEVLDLLNRKFDLQHLDIKPANLFLVSNHVKVADFGLVNQMTGANADKIQSALSAVTPLYAAPELFLGKISRHCDQYSLAIVFQELLTGSLPFDGKNVRQLLLQHTQENPNLQSLPTGDRAILARALAKNPDARFGSCLEFVRALKGESVAVAAVTSRTLTPDVATRSAEEAMGETAIVSRMRDTGPLPAKTPRPNLPDGVLADYRFSDCLSNSPLMDVWTAQRPDGVKKRVSILYGLGSPNVAKLKEALVRLQSIHHPALFMPEVLHIEPGRLVLQTDPQRETLRARAHQFQARKQPGIPRGELVDYIRAAAEVLDYLYLQHNVQHLNLNARNLILDNGWLQIGEFGYAQLLWAPAGQSIVERNVRYAAPELATNTPSRHSDQFSLALIFAEMLTGVHPFRGLGPTSYLKNASAPDLDKLPEMDREVVQRALSTDPTKRFANCTEMVLALEGTSIELNQELEARPSHFARLVATERNARKKSHVSSESEIDYKAVISELIRKAGGNIEQSACEPVMNQSNDAMTFQFIAGIPLGSAHEQLRGFCSQTGARVISEVDQRVVVQYDLAASRWQQLWGTKPVMELAVELVRVNPMSVTPIEIKAELKVRHCSKQKSLELFRTLGTDLFSSLQERMLINSEKRTKDRLLWPHPVLIVPIDRNGQPEEPIECRGKDLSHTGIGIYLPHDLDTAEVLVELPSPFKGNPVRIPAKLVRVKPTADGWYEVGALFHLPVHKPALAGAGI